MPASPDGSRILERCCDLLAGTQLVQESLGVPMWMLPALCPPSGVTASQTRLPPLVGDQCLQMAMYACQFTCKFNSVYWVEPLLLCGANYHCSNALGAS